MADNQNPQDEQSFEHLIFDWNNPSMTTRPARQAREEAQKVSEENRVKREEIHQSTIEERKAELLRQRREKTQNTSRLSGTAGGRRNVRRPAAAKTRTVRKKTGGNGWLKSLVPAGGIPRTWLIRGGAGMAAVLVLIIVIWGLTHMGGGARRRAPQIDKSLPSYIYEDYLSVNPWSRPGISADAITGIVIHYTASPGTEAEQMRDYFESLGEGSGTRASSHFVIGTDGKILICVPLGEVAYASNSRNMDTISIEYCHSDESGALSEECYRSLVKLTKWLLDRYSLSAEDVIRHYDILGKVCPKYFVDHPEDWEKFLSDVEKEPVSDGT